jgi:hypothetical protein
MKSEFKKENTLELALECVEYVLRDSHEDNIKFESMARLRSSDFPLTQSNQFANDLCTHTHALLYANNLDVKD